MGTANTGNNDNESQFFFTLGPTQELQNKHTIFGKVGGNTLYNLVKFNDLDIDRVSLYDTLIDVRATSIFLFF